MLYLFKEVEKIHIRLVFKTQRSSNPLRIFSLSFSLKPQYTLAEPRRPPAPRLLAPSWLFSFSLSLSLSFSRTPTQHSFGLALVFFLLFMYIHRNVQVTCKWRKKKVFQPFFVCSEGRADLFNQRQFFSFFFEKRLPRRRFIPTTSDLRLPRKGGVMWAMVGAWRAAQCVRLCAVQESLDLLKLLANRKMTTIIMINDTFKICY